MSKTKEEYDEERAEELRQERRRDMYRCAALQGLLSGLLRAPYYGKLTDTIIKVLAKDAARIGDAAFEEANQ